MQLATPSATLPAPAPAWHDVHAHCLGLARRGAALDRELGRAALAALRAEVDRRLGLGSFAEYAERVFGWSPRVTAERLRVAAALESLGAIDRALSDGELSWSAVRELTRVATAATQAAWLQAAAGRTVRELEAQVSGRGPGDLPGDPPRAEAELHVLRFEVDAATYALVRQAVVALREAQGGDLDDAAALALMARAALGGPGDSGRASHQIMIRECPSCGVVRQEGGGRVVVVDDQVAERARCDAQVFDAPGGARAAGAAGAASARHARQDVPPAVRREVLRRDAGRCQAPGCRAACFLDVHHVVARADGGSHEPSNLTTLCGRHHAAAHVGRLIVTAAASDDPAVAAGAAAVFVFRHADGTAYGHPPRPGLVDALAGAFVALRARGWGEGAARRAVDAVATHVGASTSAAEVIDRCLAAAGLGTRQREAGGGEAAQI